MPLFTNDTCGYRAMCKFAVVIIRDCLRHAKVAYNIKTFKFLIPAVDAEHCLFAYANRCAHCRLIVTLLCFILRGYVLVCIQRFKFVLRLFRMC